MTALKPLENLRVRAVASERYPLNKKCAHPECSEAAVDPHHAFPRSLIAGDSWFVEIERDLATIGGQQIPDSVVLPHVTGLCRAHHDDVEEHRAWIRLEEDEWRWYDRGEDVEYPHVEGSPDIETEWLGLGPLNPQPGSIEGKPKRRKFKGEARRKRKTISIRVPDDAAEDGAGLLFDAVEQLEERISGENHRPPYHTLLDALNWTLIHSDRTDF